MTAAEALNTTPRNGRPVILVVDDETGIREFLATYLQSKNLQVLTAGTAEEALAIWAEEKGRIDLLITDIVMPGMNGKMLAEKLMAEKPTLPVIFMSGYVPQEIAAETLNGVFFKKPFHPQELLQAIREALH
jgi:two-component system, cell cycle sensor histidine kinase and response regulator CckA